MRLLTILLVCLSANAGTFSVVHPAAAAWRSNCVSIQASSANTVGHFYAVNQLTKELTYSGVYQKLYMLNPVAGDNYLSALLTVKQPSGLALNWANTGSFAAGNYTPTTGLTGNGSSTWANTLFNPVSLGIDTNNMSLSVSCLSTTAMGSTRVFIGNLDAASQATDIGTLIAGTIDTGVIGASQGAQYPGGRTNAESVAVLMVNANQWPMNFAQTVGTSIAAPGRTGTSPYIQGCANDTVYGYMIYSDKIVKYQLSDNVTVLTNATPFNGLSPTNFSHLGDGCIYGGKLLVAAEGYSNVSQTASNASFMQFNTNTLALENVFSITNITPSAGGCVVGGGYLWVIAGAQEQHTNIFKFDPDTFAYRGTLTMDCELPVIQGIEYTNNTLIVTEGGFNASMFHIIAVNPTNGTTQLLMRIAGYTEFEGCMWKDGYLAIAANLSSAFVIDSFLFTPSATAARRSQTYYVNGNPIGIPGLALTGLANNNFYFGAINNNGSAASFANRATSVTSIGQGMTWDEARKYSTATTRFDRTLGRR